MPLDRKIKRIAQAVPKSSSNGRAEFLPPAIKTRSKMGLAFIGYGGSSDELKIELCDVLLDPVCLNHQFVSARSDRRNSCRPCGKNAAFFSPPGRLLVLDCGFGRILIRRPSQP